MIDDDGSECPRGVPGDVARAPLRRPRRPRSGVLPRLLEERRRDARASSPATGDSWCRTGDTRRRATRTATSGTRAAPTTCSRRRATASGRARSRTAWSSTRRSPTPRSCPSPTRERGALVKAYVVLARRATPATTALVGAAAGARARQAGALRVPEGDRVHRRAADDDDRQGAAPRAAPARGGKGEGAAARDRRRLAWRARRLSR